VANDAAVFLRDTGQETRYVDQAEQWHVEGVARADETSRLVRRIDVQRALQD